MLGVSLVQGERLREMIQSSGTALILGSSMGG